jgi:titin
MVFAQYGNASATLTLRAGSTGGVPLSRYEYTLDGGTTWTTLTAGSTPGTWRVSDLTNGTRYSVKVRAVNPVGVSGPSNGRGVIPHTVPDAPTLVALPYQGNVVNAYFNEPVNNGGEKVDYYAYSLDGGTTWITWGRFAKSPELVKGLKLNINYSIIVRAHNSAGWGPDSNVLSVIPRRH